MIILNCEVVRDEIIKKAHETIDLVYKYNVLPKLAVIQIGNDKASSLYVRNKEKLCRELGIACETISFPACQQNILLNAVKSKILELVNDDSCHGIMIQLPVPNGLLTDTQVEYLINLIPFNKDVDCLTNMGKSMMYNKKQGARPCTPSGIIELLRYYNIDMEGKNATIVGRSELVGRPLSVMLEQENATVTLCHSKTSDLREYTLKSDIVITAIGKPKYFDNTYFTRNTVIVDVGINHDENGKLCGDVDIETLENIENCLVTPVPKGVGILTTAQLALNTALLAKYSI